MMASVNPHPARAAFAVRVAQRISSRCAGVSAPRSMPATSSRHPVLISSRIDRRRNLPERKIHRAVRWCRLRARRRAIGAPPAAVAQAARQCHLRRARPRAARAVATSDPRQARGCVHRTDSRADSRPASAATTPRVDRATGGPSIPGLMTWIALHRARAGPRALAPCSRGFASARRAVACRTCGRRWRSTRAGSRRCTSTTAR